MVVFQGALRLSRPTKAPHRVQLLRSVEHERGTRLTDTAPILCPRLFADGLERFNGLAPAL